jgi:hypothetical protein
MRAAAERAARADPRSAIVARVKTWSLPNSGNP